jgi:nucleoid DNA-binding protein
MKKYTKDIIKELAKEYGYSMKDTRNLIAALTDTIIKDTREGDTVSLCDFGTFYVGTTPAHTGRNPRANTSVDVPERKHFKFKPSTKVKKSLRENDEELEF